MPLLSNKAKAKKKKNFGKKKKKAKAKLTKATETKLRATPCVLLSVVFHSVGQLLQRLV